jgi:hypothetical protein
MKEFFKEISCEEMGNILNNQGFLGKKMEVGLSYPIYCTNTYHHFDYEFQSINDKYDTLVLYDRNKEFPHEIKISKNTIDKIVYSKGETIFDTAFSIITKTDRIDFCIAERKIHCCHCGKMINEDPWASIWKISGVGNYGDKYFDGDNLKDIPLCSDCLFYKVFGYTDVDIFKLNVN